MPAPSPLEPPLRRLWQDLSIGNGICWQVHSRLVRQKADLQSAVASGARPLASLGAGANLIIRDLTQFHNDNWARPFGVGGYHVSGKNYIQIIDPLLEMYHGWTIAQGYERLETFLRDAAAVILSQIPGSEGATWRSLRRLIQPPHRPPRSLSGWARRVRQSNPSGAQILRFAGATNQAFSHGLTRNSYALDLNTWYQAATLVRHAMTHCSGLLKPGDRPGNVRTMLRRQFGWRRSAGQYAMHSTLDQAREALVHFAEIGFLLFKEVSIAQGWSWTHVAPERPADPVAV